MGHRLKESTIISKRYMVDKKILPVFGKIPINEITPKDIRKWQNGLTAYRDKNGKPYAQTYLRAINNQLTAMFNYAVNIMIYGKIHAQKLEAQEKAMQKKCSSGQRQNLNSLLQLYRISQLLIQPS